MMEKNFLKGIFEEKIAIGLTFLSLCLFTLSVLKRFKIISEENLFGQSVSLFSPAIIAIIAGFFLVSAILAYFKKYKIAIFFILLVIIGTTFFVRTSNMENLKDVVTGDWTLGPDLDPFLYLRHANEIANGTLENPDKMRAAPLGADNYAYTNLMPWAIFLFQRMLSLFSPVSMTYSAIIIPVIFFCTSILTFFFFTYFLFRLKFSKKKSSITALFASFVYSIIPSMIGRTVAGDPEIESLGMVWFWLAFLFYILAWKKEEQNIKIIFGCLSGIFTGLMSWTWGGYRFIYLIIGLTTLILFLFNKERKNNQTVFFSWVGVSLIIEFLKEGSIFSIITRVSDTGFAFVIALFLIANLLLKKEFIKKRAEKIKIPSEFLSILLVIAVAFLALLIFRRDILFSLIERIFEGFLYPWGRERIGLTVAENRAPYFSEVLVEYGNLSWLFIAGVLLLFYKSTAHFKSPNEGEIKKNIFPVFAVASILILFYAGSVVLSETYSQAIDQTDFLILLPIFLSLILAIYFILSEDKELSLSFSFFFLILALIFSRVSPQSPLLNGESLFSKGLYFAGLILLTGVVGTLILKAYLRKDQETLDNFKKINFQSILILAFSFWGIVSMRGAVRLFFIISPILIITSSLLLPEMYPSKEKREKKKSFVAILLLFLVFIQITAIYSYQSQYSVGGMIPSAYHQQWQTAMNWVKESTPKESVFVHWWDYGYWIQTMGERATTVDGGHQWGYWDHLVGRYILTSPSPESALSMIKTYNVSYLLIDSSDIGKYAAFSKIGSDKDGEDRYAQIPIFPLDSRQTIETSNKTTKVYSSIGLVDEDIIYSSGNESEDVFLPKNKAYIVFVVVEHSLNGTGTSLSQPKAGFIYNNQQIFIPVRYLHSEGKTIDYGGGLNATIVMIPKVNDAQTGIDKMGAVIYLSPKVSKSLLAQIYLLGNIKGRYSEFKLAHTEPDFYISYLKSMGLDVGDFVYVAGNLRGPIKIWKVSPDENILTHKEFLKTSGEYAEFDNLKFVKENSI